jgi:hypothetical protein
MGENNVLNGLYLLGQERFNGRHYWEKLGFDKVQVFIRWHQAGIWIFDNELTKDYKGMAFVKQDVVYPSLVTRDWCVYSNGRFQTDPSMKLMAHGKGVRIDKKESVESVSFQSVPINDVPHETTRIKLPLLRSLSVLEGYQIQRRESVHRNAAESIRVHGDHPRALFTNGIYTKSETLTHAGRPVWKKTDGSYACLIRWHEMGLWVISDFLNDRLSGFALVQDPLATDPTRVRRDWKVLGGSGMGYIKHPALKVVSLDEDDQFSAEDDKKFEQQRSVFE